MAIQIGNMRYQIDIQYSTIIKDDYGSPSETWVTAFLLRRAVKYVSGNKAIDTDEVFSSQTVQFITHYRGTINEKMRILFSGKKYRILFIDEIGFKEGLTIT